MRKFKVGDVLVCIEPFQTYLVQGEVYSVISTGYSDDISDCTNSKFGIYIKYADNSDSFQHSNYCYSEDRFDYDVKIERRKKLERILDEEI